MGFRAVLIHFLSQVLSERSDRRLVPLRENMVLARTVYLGRFINEGDHFLRE